VSSGRHWTLSYRLQKKRVCSILGLTLTNLDTVSYFYINDSHPDTSTYYTYVYKKQLRRSVINLGGPGLRPPLSLHQSRLSSLPSRRLPGGLGRIRSKKKVKGRYSSSWGEPPPQSNGTSLAIWDHTVLPSTRHK